MTDTEILAKLQNICEVVFDKYDGKITPSTSAKDISQWDSLANVQIMVMVEQEFRVKFSTDEIANLQDIGQIVEAIRAKRG